MRTLVGVGFGLMGLVLLLAAGQAGCGGRGAIGKADGGMDLAGDRPGDTSADRTEVGADLADAGDAGDTGGTGGNGGRIVFQFPGNRDLDLLFLVDDSVSMAPLQAKFRARLPDFLNALASLPGGLPNLHAAIVSSSLGAGIFGNVSGCQPGTIGNLNGAFQHSTACTALPPSEHFIKSIAGQNNFTGNIADVLGCIANIGASGCGFEHQFEATRLALQRARNMSDPDNAGFLRDNALLAIVMLTNEDDCSVDAISMLFDPNQQTLADPLGGLQSYRCNEFGHRCDQPLPHGATGLPMTLTNCRSAEDGKVVTVDGFVRFVRSLKANPAQQIMVAALTGPVAPYTVGARTFTLGTGAMESQPAIEHSCTQGTAAGAAPEYADPAIRIKQWLDGFGTNGVLESICAPDLGPSSTRIAQVIGRILAGANCVPGNVALMGNGNPDCRVVETSRNGAGVLVDTMLPFCDAGRPVVPCWELSTSAQCSGARGAFQICWDAGCTAAATPTDTRSVELFCTFTP